MSNGGDGQKFSNIAANTAPFSLLGGRYLVAATATGSGTMGLQRLGPDGTTYVAAHTAFAAVAGYIVLDLAPGTYKFVIATFTAVCAEVTAIPRY